MLEACRPYAELLYKVSLDWHKQQTPYDRAHYGPNSTKKGDYDNDEIKPLIESGRGIGETHKVYG